MSTHLDRKELKRPDAFLTRAEHIVKFINENSRQILIALGTLFALGLVVAFYNNMMAKKEAEASTKLYAVHKAFEAALPEPAKASADWEQKAQKAMADLEAAAKEHDNTVAAYEAWLALGDAFYERGNPAKAAEYYRQAIEQANSKETKALAKHSLAYALEQNKNNAEAIRILEEIDSSGNKALRPDVLLALARNHELTGNKSKAGEYYDRAIKEFPGTATARSAEAQKKNLR